MVCVFGMRQEGLRKTERRSGSLSYIRSSCEVYVVADCVLSVCVLAG